MKFRYKIINKESKIVFSNITQNDEDSINQVDKVSLIIKNGKNSTRCGFISNVDGAIYAFSEDSDYVNSSKKFSSTIQFLANTLQTFNEITANYKNNININTSRLLHNLTSLNAHNIQEIHLLFSQESLSRSTAGQQLSIVEGIIKNEPRDAALAILRMAKNNAAMKTEFSVFNKLFDSNPRLEMKSHNVHKVLMNILYLFFPDFTDKSVKVLIDCPENITAFFDYESVHVAFYHLIENSVKYVKPNTNLKIDISTIDNIVSVTFSMISLLIDKSEIKNIFNEGYSGDVAKKTGKSGNGIGMTRAKNILEINGAHISVEIFPETIHEHFGIPYQNNRFQIKLNTKRSTN